MLNAEKEPSSRACIKPGQAHCYSITGLLADDTQRAGRFRRVCAGREGARHLHGQHPGLRLL